MTVQKMNPEVKAQWLEALRSGKYKQGRGTLKRDDTYCCLGVLCDISGLGRWGAEGGMEEGLYFIGEASFGGTLDETLQRWSGVDSHGNYAPSPRAEGEGYDCLTRDNDHGKTFEEIADIIEEYL